MRALSCHIAIICLLCISCSDDPRLVEIGELEVMEVPKGFPDIVHPTGNEFTMNRWTLGKKLFYDPILSIDKTISCASCHDPSLAFSNDERVSTGAGGLLGTRNSPTLANVAYHPYFTREGGVPTLEMQILVPIQEHNEFNNNIVLIVDTLAKMDDYVHMANVAYEQDISAFVITRALAQFERSMISGQSAYDLANHYDIEDAMTQSAIRGQLLFESDRLSCATCHSGFNFTDYSFRNNGLYEEYPDQGRERLTLDPADRALFKVPTLRNVSITGPYMHDGSIENLSDVIEHYDSGGKNHFQKDSNIQPLTLTLDEKADLLAFLESLTDQRFITNKNLSND